MARLVRAALKDLPSPFREKLSNVDFVVARRPAKGEMRRMGFRGDALYGLYQGIPLPERGSGYTFVPPDKITIYWEPLLTHFPSDEELAEQVKKTVYHEIAHHFGISDGELRRTAVE